MFRRDIRNQQQIFGKEMPIIFIGNVEYQLPPAGKGSRAEDFPEDYRLWIDLTHEEVKRTRGFRLAAEYKWPTLTNIELNDLLTIYNETKSRAVLTIKFTTIPRRYRINIKNFRIGLSGGYSFRNMASVEISGKDLLNSFPNPDLFYVFAPLLGRGLIIR